MLASGLVGVACGTAPLPSLPGVDPSDAGAFDLSGHAVKGPISGGTVTAYKLLPDLSPGDELASATTDETGFFALTLPRYRRCDRELRHTPLLGCRNIGPAPGAVK